MDNKSRLQANKSLFKKNSLLYNTIEKYEAHDEIRIDKANKAIERDRDYAKLEEYEPIDHEFLIKKNNIITSIKVKQGRSGCAIPATIITFIVFMFFLGSLMTLPNLFTEISNNPVQKAIPQSVFLYLIITTITLVLIICSYLSLSYWMNKVIIKINKDELSIHKDFFTLQTKKRFNVNDIKKVQVELSDATIKVKNSYDYISTYNLTISTFEGTKQNIMEHSLEHRRLAVIGHIIEKTININKQTLNQ